MKKTMTTDWAPEPREIPEELTDTYQAAPYRDPFMVPILEKLNTADRDALVALMGGWPIIPNDD